ncbi:MAG: hypothetical protein KF847_10070 [Pirellulales bacterium]|nr:hypothetical protein [Pirellulales bacterium]
MQDESDAAQFDRAHLFARSLPVRRRVGSLAAIGAWIAFVASFCAERALGASALIERLEAGQHQTIVVYGTSLTAGGAWVSQIATALNSQFPGQITWVNSGQSGKASNTGVAMLQAAVLAHSPDAVFIEFAMNDSFTAYATTDLDYDISPAESKFNLSSMIDSIQSARPSAEVILQTMNPTWNAPNGNGSATKRPQLATYYQGYRDFAAERGLLLVDNNLVWQKVQANTPDVFRAYVADGTHPNAAGYSTATTPAILWNLGAGTGLTLAVDLESGRAVLQNRSNLPIDLISYSIRSASGALRISTWSSLEGRGNSKWVEANPTSFALSELNAVGSTSVIPGTEIHLGEAWNASKALDLTLVYQSLDGGLHSGAVVYTSLANDTGLSGDYNRDKSVDGADFIEWQRSFSASISPFTGADANGDGVVNGDDLVAWRESYGAPRLALSTAIAVPEPPAMVAASAFVLPFLISSRRTHP